MTTHKTFEEEVTDAFTNYQPVFSDHMFSNAVKQVVAAHIAALDKAVQEAQLNGVGWAIMTIDELHMTHTGSLLHSHTMAAEDTVYKGIKNTLRDYYKEIVGTDPAPHYPIRANLKKGK